MTIKTTSPLFTAISRAVGQWDNIWVVSTIDCKAMESCVIRFVAMDIEVYTAPKFSVNKFNKVVSSNILIKDRVWGLLNLNSFDKELVS